MINIYDYSDDNELNLEFSLKTIEIIKKQLKKNLVVSLFQIVLTQDTKLIDDY